MLQRDTSRLLSIAVLRPTCFGRISRHHAAMARHQVSSHGGMRPRPVHLGVACVDKIQDLLRRLLARPAAAQAKQRRVTQQDRLPHVTGLGTEGSKQWQQSEKLILAKT
jgi:hypothetical protein